MKLILGSSSKYRRAVLEKAGYMFEIMSPDIDEDAIQTDDTYQLSLLIARAKMDALIPRVTEDAIVIASDQVVMCDNTVHQKPKDAAEAKRFLQKYSNGHAPETVSAVVVTNTKNGKRAEGVDIVKIHFGAIPESAMDEFIATHDPYSRAGGFGIHPSPISAYIKKIDGTEDSTMGMPLALLERLIAEVQ